MATLFDPPDTYGLSVSWHNDLVIDFENFDPDAAALNPPVWTPLNWDTTTAYLDIKAPTDVADYQRFTAVITGSHAIVRVESEIADTLKNGQLWTFYPSYPGTPTTEPPTVNGVIERHDGKPA